jgi:hypothetical protein
MRGIRRPHSGDPDRRRGDRARRGPLVWAVALLVGLGAVLSVALTPGDDGDGHTRAMRSTSAAEAEVAADLEREAHLAGQAATHGAAPRTGSIDQDPAPGRTGPSGCAQFGSADDVLPGSRRVPRC